MRTADGTLQSYVGGGHRRVQGWLSDLDARVVAHVADLQRCEGVHGSVAEIGVHHGRLFILLALATAADEVPLAIDLFEEQAQNVDASGKGDEGALDRNLATWGIAAGRVAKIRGNSLDLTPAEVTRTARGQVRLFSVDGGHTADITDNDLNVALDSLADGGVIILDDYFNREWASVSEGANRFFGARRSEVAVIAFSDNKTLIARPEWADRYRRHLAAALPASVIHKTLTFGDHEVLIVRTPNLKARVKAGLVKAPLFETVKRSRVGKKLKDPINYWFG